MKSGKDQACISNVGPLGGFVQGTLGQPFPHLWALPVPQAYIPAPALKGLPFSQTFSGDYLGDQTGSVGSQRLQVLLLGRFCLPLVGLKDPRHGNTENVPEETQSRGL